MCTVHRRPASERRAAGAGPAGLLPCAIGVFPPAAAASAPLRRLLRRLLRALLRPLLRAGGDGPFRALPLPSPGRRACRGGLRTSGPRWVLRGPRARKPDRRSGDARCPARPLGGRRGVPRERRPPGVRRGEPRRPPLRGGAAGVLRPAPRTPEPRRRRGPLRAPVDARRPHHRPPLQHHRRRGRHTCRRRGRAVRRAEPRAAPAVRPVEVPPRRPDGIGRGAPGGPDGPSADRGEPRLAGRRPGARQHGDPARGGRAGPPGHARPAAPERGHGGGLDSRLDVLLAARLQLRLRRVRAHRPRRRGLPDPALQRRDPAQGRHLGRADGTRRFRPAGQQAVAARRQRLGPLGHLAVVPDGASRRSPRPTGRPLSDDPQGGRPLGGFPRAGRAASGLPGLLGGDDDQHEHRYGRAPARRTPRRRGPRRRAGPAGGRGPLVRRRRATLHRHLPDVRPARLSAHRRRTARTGQRGGLHGAPLQHGPGRPAPGAGHHVQGTAAAQRGAHSRERPDRALGCERLDPQHLVLRPRMGGHRAAGEGPSGPGLGPGQAEPARGAAREGGPGGQALVGRTTGLDGLDRRPHAGGTRRGGAPHPGGRSDVAP